jgi:uncharacterized protein (DUF433 family)
MQTETATQFAAVETIPLQTDRDGVVRVGNTRVTLDSIVTGFLEGATAEELAQQYPSVQWADIYSVSGYYLRQRSAVETYLQRRQQRADLVREQNESRFDPAGIRGRLQARQANRRP